MSLESERNQFDALTHRMTEINEVSISAPIEHQPMHSLAFQRTHNKARELLSANPELEDFYREAGRFVLKVSVDVYQEFRSERYLQVYLRSGLLHNKDFDKPEVRPVKDAFDYSREDCEAFQQLFPVIITEPELEPELEDEEEADEPDEIDFSERINDLDILEHLEKRGEFTTADLSYVWAALTLPKVRPLDLRESEWEVVSLSNTEYKEFVDQLDRVRGKVMLLLREVNVPFRWIEVGTGQSKGWKLLIGEDANLPLKPREANKLIPPAQKALQPEADRTVVPAALDKDDQALLAVVKKQMLLSSDWRLSHIINLTSKAVGDEMSRLELREKFTSFVNEGHLFWGKPESGSRTLLTEKPPEPIKRHRSTKNGGSGDDEPTFDREYTVQDFILTGRVCEALGKEYPEKGKTFPALAKMLGISEDDLKLNVSAAVDKKVLIRQLRRIRKSGHRSRANRQGTFVMFPDKASWDRYRENPGEYLRVMMPEDLNTNE